MLNDRTAHRIALCPQSLTRIHGCIDPLQLFAFHSAHLANFKLVGQEFGSEAEVRGQNVYSTDPM